MFLVAFIEEQKRVICSFAVALCVCLNGAARTICAKAPSLRVSSDGHHFVDQNDGNAPFFWMGDTNWQLMTNFSSSDVQAYLSDRQRKGFTVIQTALVYSWKDPSCVKPNANMSGEGPWLNGDPANPNASYFRNVDDVIEQAAEHGIVLGLFPVVAHECIASPPHVVNLLNSYSFGQWLGTRYRSAPNIVWILGGDVEPASYESVFASLAAGLKAGDQGSHLMTYHGLLSSSQVFENASWLDFNMIETSGDPQDLYRVLESDYRLLPAKPTGLGEGDYENTLYRGRPASPHVIRNQAYWAYVGGGYQTYGNDSIMVWHPKWAAHLSDPGARQMALAGAFLRSHHWPELLPDQTVIISGAGRGLHQNCAAVSRDGAHAVIYLSNRTTVKIRMSVIRSSRNLKAIWFDPRTGSQKTAGIFANRGVVSFSTPSSLDDAVLVLDGVTSPSR